MKKRIIGLSAIAIIAVLSFVNPFNAKAQENPDEELCRHFRVCNTGWYWACDTGWSIWGECGPGDYTTPPEVCNS